MNIKVGLLSLFLIATVNSFNVVKTKIRIEKENINQYFKEQIVKNTYYLELDGSIFIDYYAVLDALNNEISTLKYINLLAVKYEDLSSYSYPLYCKYMEVDFEINSGFYDEYFKLKASIERR